MRLLALIVGLATTLCSLSASTLQRLTLEEMIQKSTAIVRCRVVASRTSMRGPVIYTVERVAVAESWKGDGASQIEVAIPGGLHGAVRQTFSGTPQLDGSAEYVLFLWTGKSGVTQVIGLSQGVFRISTSDDGVLIVERPASQAMVLDASGNTVKDKAVSYQLEELRQRVAAATGN